MGSTLRHIVDSGVKSDPVTLVVLLFVLLMLNLNLRKSTGTFIFVSLLTVLACDMPWDQSLMKRSGVLEPVIAQLDPAIAQIKQHLEL